MKKIIFLIILLGILIIIGRRNNTKNPNEEIKSTEIKDAEIVASGLEIPWEMEFLPDSGMLITQRAGSVVLLESGNENKIKQVAHVGEAGLLGMALDPDYAKNNYIYLYYTYEEKQNLFNKVSRFNFDGVNLNNEKVILDGIPGYRFHDGGRIKFGPDGKLYVSTGDAGNSSSAQDKNSLSGKILRINKDGTIPTNNPFSGSPIYSYGHRNPQGLTWDTKGNLWSVEHGQNAHDEINLIIPGKNYGWPESFGQTVKEATEKPVLESGEETWAPSGAVAIGDKLFFAGLAGRALYIFDLNTYKLSKAFEGEYGRLRTVTKSPDGTIYLLTSNLDGRNESPSPEDDRLIRINLK